MLGTTTLYSFVDHLRNLGTAGESGLFSTGDAGRGLNEAEVEALVADFRTAGGIVDKSLAAQRYLALRQAGGLTLNATTILLPARPTRTTVFEELVHAFQFGRGTAIGRLTVLELEIEAAEVLIGCRKTFELPAGEVRQVIQNLRGMRKTLHDL